VSSTGVARRVLGIDTATRAGSVALVEASDDGPAARLAEVTHGENLRHAETLLPAIDRCLEQARCRLEDVHGIAVSIGPGSFTGLRVGLATAKGLALATGAWLVGVPTLEAYARAVAGRPGPICVCLDARKGEVYSALFATAGPPARGLRRLLEDGVEGPGQAAVRVVAGLDRVRAGSRLREVQPTLRELGSTLRVVGDAAERYPGELVAVLRRSVSVEALPETARGRAAAVAELGLVRFREDGPADASLLGPAYLRASEAELRRRETLREPRETH